MTDHIGVMSVICHTHSSERGIKVHKSRCHKEEKDQVFENRLADEMV